MAQAKTITQFNSFIGGLITEATELTYPPNSSSDELNCDIFVKGNRKSRRGIDFESNYMLSSFTSTDTDLITNAVSIHRWNSVDNDSNRTFSVVQVGSTLHFYKVTSAISQYEKSFTINLDTYKVSSYYTAALDIVSCDSGKGDLYVVSPAIEPIRVSYNVDTDTITVNLVNIRIRDFEGVDDGLDIDERPSTLSNSHNYNLLNQGWYPTTGGYNPLSSYYASAHLYPANNMQWFTAKTATGAIDVTNLNRYSQGNTPASKGHFILNPFYKDRSSASGIPNIPIESTDDRPVAVCFYSGRVVYALGNSLYISEVLNKSRDNYGKCYQDGDPTSEATPDLIDTDGTVIPITDMGNVMYLVVLQTSLIIFADNGVWRLSGSSSSGFRTTDFEVNKITGSGTLSRTSVIDAEGTIIWLSSSGIFAIRQDNISGLPTAISLSDTTIKTFFIGVGNTAWANSTAVYDRYNKIVKWLYKSSTAPTDSSERFYDACLNLNLTSGSFYPWKFSYYTDTDTGLYKDSPYILGAIDMPAIVYDEVVEDVINSSNVQVVTSTGEAITYTDSSTIGNDNGVKYFCAVPSTSDSSVSFTFGEIIYSENLLTDWKTYGILNYSTNEGVPYDAYIETGYDLQGDLARDKQAPYVITHMLRTETAYDNDTSSFTNPSSMYLMGKWNFTDSGRSGRWSTKQSIYRILNKDIPTETVADYSVYGNRVITSRMRVRGYGKSLQLRFENEKGKDFNLLGWAIEYTGNTSV